MKTPTRSNRVLRSLVVAVVALLATVSLAACNPDQMGAAAIVDGHVITTDQLQQATRGYLKTVPDADKSTVQLRILERMILSRIIDKAAAKENVSVSTGAVAKQRDQILASTKGPKGLVQALAQQQSPTVLAPSYIDRWVRDQLLYSRIVAKLAGSGDPASPAAANKGSETLRAAGKTMKIKINPRYGTWDPNQGVVGQISGGLSQTADQLSTGK
ncbi:MAG: SurA N-terminal domain-containing protein [Actinomycetes bacterium]